MSLSTTIPAPAGYYYLIDSLDNDEVFGRGEPVIAFIVRVEDGPDDLLAEVTPVTASGVYSRPGLIYPDGSVSLSVTGTSYPTFSDAVAEERRVIAAKESQK